jgi:hypothetical protein
VTNLNQDLTSETREHHHNFWLVSTAKRRWQKPPAERFFDAKKELPIGKCFAKATR